MIWASLPIAFELYLPEDWAGDPARRAKAGVPRTSRFRTKPQIALEQIRRALADGVPPGVILGDAGYGIDTDFRTALSRAGPGLCPGGAVHPRRLAAGLRPAAAQAMVGQGTATQAAAPGCRAPAGHRQGSRLHPAAERLADGELAGRQPRRAGAGALPPCGCGRRTATTGVPSRTPRNGC